VLFAEPILDIEPGISKPRDVINENNMQNTLFTVDLPTITDENGPFR